LTVPAQSSSSTNARKPWDLDLQPPRRQNGIEIVGHSPHRNINHRPQQRNQQYVPIGTVLPANQRLQPGFQIVNGRLIEVRGPAQQKFKLERRDDQNNQQRQKVSVIHQRQVC
jgi:hypothetical protein